MCHSNRSWFWSWRGLKQNSRGQREWYRHQWHLFRSRTWPSQWHCWREGPKTSNGKARCSHKRGEGEARTSIVSFLHGHTYQRPSFPYPAIYMCKHTHVRVCVRVRVCECAYTGTHTSVHHSSLDLDNRRIFCKMQFPSPNIHSFHLWQIVTYKIKKKKKYK